MNVRGDKFGLLGMIEEMMSQTEAIHEGENRKTNGYSETKASASDVDKERRTYREYQLDKSTCLIFYTLNNLCCASSFSECHSHYKSPRINFAREIK